MNVTDCREDEIFEFHMSNAQFETFRPQNVCICLKQGDYVPADPVVAVGDYVLRGQKIGESSSSRSLPVFASISGHVTRIFQERQSVYENVTYVVIQADFPQQTEDRLEMDHEKDLITGLKEMGIAGIDKTSSCSEKNIKLCLGAFDREPMVYAQYRLLVECPAKVLFGARVMAKALGCQSIDIFVCQDEVRYILEKAIHCYKKALLPLERICFYAAPEDIYGRNRVLYENHSDRLWFEPSQLCAVYDSFYDHYPMIARGISISGKVKYPKNLWVPNGAYVRDLVDYCGGFDCKDGGEETMGICFGYHVIEGGPLRGHCVDIEKAAVSLTTESITVLPWNMYREEGCIGCQDCVRVCPAGLKPFRIEKTMEKGLGHVHLAMAGECVECGWCSYVCPSHRRLKEKVAAAKKMSASHSSKEIKKEKKSGEAFRAVASDYIDLEPSMAQTMENIVPVSHGGPYLHGNNNIHALWGIRFRALSVVFLLYVCVAGPQLLVKALWGGGSFFILSLALSGRRRFDGISSLWPAVEEGILSSMVFAFIPSLRWPVVCGIISVIAKRWSAVNPYLVGIGLTTAACAMTRQMITESPVIICAGWMAAWGYMLFKKIAVFWTTPMFLLGYAAVRWISGGLWLWSPAVFMGAVFFANDYKNGGKGTLLQHMSGVLSGLFAAALSLIFPAEAGVFLSLLAAHIIACNLMVYTI
ncbi:Na+-translocating ferredoxin:NAD+ oxidoreductase RnfC subunit [Catenibacillus scindens]|uniref:Na+-translocating ferredoxin:NAD+ oxidoreductase RnfC subunit n=1 Tax=Catenibacillus scindens TaxID=673271 RepID=A0A7W8HA35_9FIRM|nr:Na+-translocating ferredoxin:NAD+ oxidoreductase RnfC subunit [Catenibacillus scindens]